MKKFGVMMRSAAVLFACAAVAVAAAAGADTGTTPPPHPGAHATPHSTPWPAFAVPTINPHAIINMSGPQCQSGSNMMATQRTVNPINGQPQAKTLVSIPIGKGAGTVSSSTQRQNNIQACAH